MTVDLASLQSWDGARRVFAGPGSGAGLAKSVDTNHIWLRLGKDSHAAIEITGNDTLVSTVSSYG